MRDGAHPARGTRRFGSLTIDYDAREVLLDGIPVALTKTEYLLLIALAEVPRKAMTSADLMRAIWGTNWVDDVGALQVQVSRLRAKLGESGSKPSRITSVRGYGYRFDPGVVEGPVSTVELLYDADFFLRGITPFEPFLGYSPEQVLHTLFSPSGLDAEHLRTTVDALIASQTFTLDGYTWITFADGKREPLRVASTILVSDDGHFDGLHSTLFVPKGN